MGWPRSRARPTRRSTRSRSASPAPPGRRTRTSERVMNYLAGNGYSYDEYPPPTPYPLATFLLLNRIGYCQQFAGSMALLLRMGGIPARVATGFTTGTYDAASKRWLVTRRRCPRLGRGVVPALRLDHVRSHAAGGAGARRSLGDQLRGRARRQRRPRASSAAETQCAGHRGDRPRAACIPAARSRPCLLGHARCAGRAVGAGPRRLEPDRSARRRRAPGRARACAGPQRTPDRRRRDAGRARAALPNLTRGGGLHPGAAHGALRRRHRAAHAAPAARAARPAPSRARPVRAHCARCGPCRPGRNARGGAAGGA